MKDNDLGEMIKNNNSESALKEMEELLKNSISRRMEKNNISILTEKQENFNNFLEECIKQCPNDYEMLTFIRNTIFFSEKSDSEKIYDLLSIYDILNEE